jgi:hypothetical protein
MKKQLLFFVCVLMSISIMAQSPLRNNTPVKSSQHWMELNQNLADPEQPFTVNMVPGSPKAVKFPVSSSANVYTLLVSESSCLSYNSSLKTINFVHRANPSGGLGTSSGNVVSSYSTTGGILWTQAFLTNDTKSNRYPSGVLYNPVGNTEPSNAFVVGSGPVTDGTNWVENFWASTRLNGNNSSVVYENYSVYNQEFPRFGFSAGSDGKLHVLGNKYIFTTGVGVTTFNHLTMNNGTFNSANNKFDWTRVNIVPSIAKLAADNTYEVATYSTAWSADGSTGYVYIIGIDSAYPNTSYVPILYKSIDAGASWVKQPNFDFSTLSAISANIWATLGDPNTARPYFSSEGEGVVDNNGNFHWFGIVKGAYSTHPDSLGYTFLFEDNVLYHLWTTTSGWDAEQVDVIWTNSVASTDGQYGSGTDATGWDHRIQAARSNDGTKVFCVWSDTDTLFAVLNASGREINSSPDLHAWGKNLTTSTVYPSTNFTFGTPLEAECFFHYVSEVIIEDGTNLIIPVTIAEIDQVSVNGPALPVYHYYVRNIGWGPTIGLNEAEKVPVMEVSEVYPNPTSGLTNLDITLQEHSNLSLQVLDMAGRIVLSKDFSNLGAGMHRLNFDMSAAARGIYVCRIQAGEKSITKKLSVE